MHLNTSTSLLHPALLLVPYTSRHVPTYHIWMQSPLLLAATASEPLSLEAEYAMQHSWRNDKDKLTFIICLPLGEENAGEVVVAGVADRAEKMIGDVNLFLFDADEEETQEGKMDGKDGVVIGELELMIAISSLHRKGYGRATLLVFIDYILSHWKAIARQYSCGGRKGGGERMLKYLRVKINESNMSSIRLFEGLGFERVEEGANYFGEVELRWVPDLQALRARKGWREWREVGYEGGGD